MNQARIEVHGEFVRVVEPSGTADFHLRWLRHNCDLDRHSTTGERTVDSAELPDELAVGEAEVAGDALVIRWLHDRRTSHYALAWLREHAYAIDRELVPLPPSDPARLEITAGDRTFVDLAREALARVATAGAAVIRRPSELAEHETEAWIEAFEATGLAVIGTHFGRIEDLRTDNTTNANTDQLGYTDAAIELHTDQPFLARPPRYQLLQSIRAAGTGGDSLIADALAAYRYLASTDAATAELVRTTPIRFHRKQRAFEAEVVAPLVTIAGDAFQIRSSYFTMAPHRVAFDRMASWYRAYDGFTRLVRNHRYQLRLAPGDVLLYDNHRALHGRTAFHGDRWVRGVYFDPS
ncbi:MAG: TauD/TfdA family dioxygenase [Kofleriaceae bacterium]